jgi:uncharacterized protein YcfL
MKYTILLISTLFLLSGCSNTQQPDPIVKIVDRCSNNDISIQDIKGRQRSDGFMQAQVTGQNLTNSYFKVEYRIVWMDENGFTIDTILSNWTDIPAYPNQPFYIHATSPNAKTQSFRLYLKKEGKLICETQSD